MSDALPQPYSLPSTQDEWEIQVCDWADYRKNYSPLPGLLAHEHRAFLAGWKAAHQRRKSEDR